MSSRKVIQLVYLLYHSTLTYVLVKCISMMIENLNKLTKYDGTLADNNLPEIKREDIAIIKIDTFKFVV